MQVTAHLAGSLSEGGRGNAKGGDGGGQGLLDASGDLEAVSLHGHGCTQIAYKHTHSLSAPLPTHRFERCPQRTSTVSLALHRGPALRRLPGAPPRMVSKTASPADARRCHVLPVAVRQGCCCWRQRQRQRQRQRPGAHRAHAKPACLGGACKSAQTLELRACERSGGPHRPWRSGAACGHPWRVP